MKKRIPSNELNTERREFQVTNKTPQRKDKVDLQSNHKMKKEPIIINE